MIGVEAAVHVQTAEQHCPECNSKMQWDAAVQAMKCQYCGKTVELSESTKSVVEYDLESGLSMARERGYGVTVRTTVCKDCGATVSFGDAATATRCEFCDSPQVMQEEGQRNVIRPESLVPFAVDKKVATGKFGTWIGKLWFRPSDLKHRAAVSEMTGMYIPYWTFDAHVASKWTAEAGYHYYETETYTTTENGQSVTKTRQVQKTRWVWKNGSRADDYDDILVCASKGLPQDLAEKLKTFDTRELRGWEPRYLAGWKAEEYAVDLNAGWKDAVERMETTQKSRCASDVPGDTHRFLSVNNQFSDETFKHVLLPLWISAYRYRDKVYRFLVNGQTGEVTGKAPYSVWKIVMFILAIVGLIVGVLVLGQYLKHRHH
jgi:ribosomal protein S27E